MKRLLLGFLVCVLGAKHDLHAKVVITPERTTVAHVAGAMDVYRILHGAWPGNWEQLKETIDLSSENRTMLRRYGYRLEDRYQFPPQPLALGRGDGGNPVLLIRAAPLYKHHLFGNERYRYIIFESLNAGAVDTAVAETDVQQMLGAANITLSVARVDPMDSEDKSPFRRWPLLIACGVVFSGLCVVMIGFRRRARGFSAR